MSERQKIIEQNQVIADYIKRHNPTNDEIRQMKVNADNFFIKVLSSPTLYHKLLEEVYTHLRNFWNHFFFIFLFFPLNDWLDIFTWYNNFGFFLTN